jgi:hypothetical protein
VSGGNPTDGRPANVSKDLSYVWPPHHRRPPSKKFHTGTGSGPLSLASQLDDQSPHFFGFKSHDPHIEF